MQSKVRFTSQMTTIAQFDNKTHACAIQVQAITTLPLKIYMRIQVKP